MIEIKETYDTDSDARLYASESHWKCGFGDDGDVQLGVYAQVYDLEAAGAEPNVDGYPIIVEFCIVAHRPGFNTRAFESLGDGNSDAEEFKSSDDYHEQMREILIDYTGGVPATVPMLGVRKEGDSESAMTEGLDVKFTPPRYPGAGVKDVRNFSDWDEAKTYARRVIENSAGTIMGLIGFTLDRPVNRVGQNGWSMINAMVEGKDWDPMPERMKRAQ